MTWLAVAIGGAAGALLRYGIAVWTKPLISGGFPYPTLIANLLGAFLMGLLFQLFQRMPIQEELKLLLTTGFLGALTTFSTLALETVNLWREGLSGIALVYLGVTNAAGILALLAGMSLAGRISN